MELNERLKKARKQGALSELMEGREKIDTAEILGKVLTIADCDVVDYDGEDGHCHYAIINVAEYPNSFIMGGKALTEIAEMIIDASEGEDIKTFCANNVVQFKAELIKTKKKLNFVKVDII